MNITGVIIQESQEHDWTFEKAVLLCKANVNRAWMKMFTHYVDLVSSQNGFTDLEKGWNSIRVWSMGRPSVAIP